jgi:hypothetical protein
MKQQRLQEILASHQSTRRYLQKWGSIRRQQLIRITTAEHKELCDNVKLRRLTTFTRSFEYGPNDWLENPDLPQRSQPPKVVDVWLGARSMGSAKSTSDQGEGFTASAEEIEEAMELTDLQTMLYEDVGAFENWVRVKAFELVARTFVKRTKTNLRKAEAVVIGELPKGPDGQPIKCMIMDDITGETRPVQYGDVIQIIQSRSRRHGGTQDDLDELFMEEADDPRPQNDWSAEGSEHRWTDRYRANTNLEQMMLNNGKEPSKKEQYRFMLSRGLHLARKEGDIDKAAFLSLKLEQHMAKFGPTLTGKDNMLLPCNAMPEGVRYMPTDLEFRRSAQEIAAKRNPKNLLALTDEIEQTLRNQFANVQFDEGELIKGYFVTKQEFFASMSEELPKRPKAHAPKAIDWAEIRLPRTRSTPSWF